MSKSYYVARLIFADYTSQPFRAEMTEKQLEALRVALDKKVGHGPFKGYVLAPPKRAEYVHALIFSADALKAELLDLIETEKRLSENR